LAIQNVITLGTRLAALVARILAASGYSVVRTAGQSDIGADFLISDLKTKETTAVEVKLYRSPKIEPRVLRNAAASIARLKKQLGIRGLLVATTIFDDRDLRLLRNIGVDEVWDVLILRDRASVDPTLARELEQLLRDAELVYTAPSKDTPVQAGPDVAETQMGHELVDRFQTTEAGAGDARKFEGICQESVEYLFGEQFGELHPQHRVEQGFQYMDLIGRLTPGETAAFWLSMAQDFRCRYVVFEFKNYSEKISQNQIYTTEKYLYPNALRSVAIIVARNGHDAGAHRAVQSAVRESGKVIIVLSLDDLVRLLKAKDNGFEPSDVLVDHIDNLLTRLAP
jgi:hypothetical protein